VCGGGIGMFQNGAVNQCFVFIALIIYGDLTTGDNDTLTVASSSRSCHRSVVDFPLQWSGFEPELSHVGFMVDIVALGQVVYEYVSFRC
jgi:hypothetical protein